MHVICTTAHSVLAVQFKVEKAKWATSFVQKYHQFLQAGYWKPTTLTALLREVLWSVDMLAGNQSQLWWVFLSTMKISSIAQVSTNSKSKGYHKSEVNFWGVSYPVIDM